MLFKADSASNTAEPSTGSREKLVEPIVTIELEIQTRFALDPKPLTATTETETPSSTKSFRSEKKSPEPLPTTAAQLERTPYEHSLDLIVIFEFRDN
jgi:hypothetical protein